MQQLAPDPTILLELVKKIKYKNWRFTVEDIDRGQGSKGLTLIIYVVCHDTYDPDHIMGVNHYMIVPPAAFDERAWRRWVFDQVLLVEQHEACEFFQVDGQRPYAPHHAPGRNPYTFVEIGTQEDAQTNYLGEHFEIRDL
jgi:hypothetical protein